ncbi:MAG TPA: acetate uptake transporter [Rhizomicrobium sp.]|jgi:succinate-acetate transporter protein|nr:acetate uptake transporter [Rhizomicrobium sp.]
MTGTIANPAPLGLAGFGLTTVLLSCVNAGLLPAGGEPVVIPLAMAFGGTAQLIAGIMEFKAGNVFGATAFTSYGAFWWWFALLMILSSNHMLDLSGAGTAVGACLLLWGVFTLGLWVSTFRLTWLSFGIFLTLWIAFFLLGAGAILANPALHAAGGWAGLASGGLALYGSFALVTNATFGRDVVPIGTRG